MPQILDNSVINSYRAGIKMKQDQEQQKFENEQKKAAAALAEQQYKSYDAHLKAQEEHQNAQLEVEKARNAEEGRLHRFNAQRQLAEMIATGNIKQAQPEQNYSPIGGPTQMVPGIPELGVAENQFQYASPQDLLAQKAKELDVVGGAQARTAGQTVGEQQKALAPYKEEEFQRRLTEVGIKQKAAEDLQKQKDAEALKRTQSSNESRLVAAGINASARRYAADKSGGMDPDAIGNNALLHATGQGGTELGNNKNDVATKLVLAKHGLVSFPAKKAEELKAIHSLDSLTGKMEEILKALPDSKTDALGQKIASKVPLSDLNNISGMVTGVAGNIAKTIGGESGRLTEQDINRALGLLVKPGITKEQAISRLKFFQETVSSKVLDQAMGGLSDKQKLLNLITYGYDPSKINKVVGKTKDGVEHHLFEKSPTTGNWLVFNASKGGYESVDATK